METLCDYIYEPFSTPSGYGKVLKRCVPRDGVFVYKISATYAKQIPCSTYYVRGRTQKEAAERFKGTVGYMKITSVVMIPLGEAEAILTDRYKIPF